MLDRSILEWNLDALPDSIEEVSIIAGEFAGDIESHLGCEYGGMRIEYLSELPADQVSQIILQGNTLYKPESIRSAIEGDLAALSDGAIEVRYPWNLLEANVARLRAVDDRRAGRIEDGATIKGDIVLEKGALIRGGCYIEGPVYIGRDSVVGPFAHLRSDTIIESGCEIGKSELYDCVVMRGTSCKHQAYIGHSVIGEDVNIGAGLITADYRHDAGLHSTLVAGEKVDTGRKKLGAFIGDRVHTGIATLIYPGRKVWPGLGTLPGEIVKKDKIAGK